VLTLIEKDLEQRMEPSNYWRRRLFLQKFDERASRAVAIRGRAISARSRSGFG
jgi:hypothetical protein